MVVDGIDDGDNHNESQSLSPDSDFAALLTSAVYDERPTHSLEAIYHAIANSAAASDLDALHIVPLLVGVANPSAGEILVLLSECGNAKEVVISVQESLEHLVNDTEYANDESDTYLRLQRLMQLYVGAIPRIKLRKRSASDTLRPLFAVLPSALEKSSVQLRPSAGREILRLLCLLLKSTIAWAEKQEDHSDLSNVKTVCSEVFLHGLADLSSSLDLRLAQGKFEACYPRLFRGKGAETDEENEGLLGAIADVGSELSFSYHSLASDRSPGALTLLAFMLSRGTLPTPLPNTLLSDLFPTLIAMISSQHALDPSFYILLHVLFPSPSNSGSSDLDPERTLPLIYALVPVACVNEDPSTRHIVFRIIGTMLSRLPALERIHALHDILTESPFPAMRIAGVGLLKEAVLDALSDTSGTGNSRSQLASPELLQKFGPVVMRPDPPDLFAKPADDDGLAKFLDSQEPKRLVECLGFYYILLLRDQNNATGVRDDGQLKSTEKELLSPLRVAVEAWLGSKTLDADEHALMALAALETALERVDGARAGLMGELEGQLL